MNCPSRPDDTERHPDWNQNPQDLNSDLTTRADLNGIVNLREQRETDSSLSNHEQDQIQDAIVHPTESPVAGSPKKASAVKVDPVLQENASDIPSATDFQRQPGSSGRLSSLEFSRRLLKKTSTTLQKYVRFVGPGFLIAVAYIDPGNYATDVEAGAATQYRHLFIILMSNLFAIFLQSLCIKLGSVTGLNLAENCRKHLPKWLTIVLYIFAESAIIATDIAEVRWEFALLFPSLSVLKPLS